MQIRTCKTCLVEKPHDDFVKHPQCKFGITHKCKSCLNEIMKRKYPDQKEVIAKRQKKSVAKRKAEGKDVYKPTREYLKRNPHHGRYHSKQRKAHVKRATPSWLTASQKVEMRNIYIASQQKTVETGVDYHVDHIVPLRGENVCGLHVPWNLRVLRADLNMAKSNLYA